MNDCPAESVLSLILNRRQLRHSRLQFLQNLPGPVTAPVVDHDNFVGDIMKPQFKTEVLDGGRDTPFLVSRGNDDAKTFELRGVRVGSHRAMEDWRIGVMGC